MQGKGENPNEDQYEMEDEDPNQAEEHGQAENQEQENGKASVGYGGNSKEGMMVAPKV